MFDDKVVRLGIRRQPGYLYFVQWNGVYKTSTKRRGPTREQGRHIRVKAIYFDREPGYFYYLDRDGDIARYRTGKEEAPSHRPWWYDDHPHW